MKLNKIVATEHIEYRNELGQLHREDGPAFEYISGIYKGLKYWYINDKWHRLDGPAFEYISGTYKGLKYWYIDGKIHRLDGPAVEYSDGTKSWFFQGKRIDCKTQEEFERIIKLAILW